MSSQADLVADSVDDYFDARACPACNKLFFGRKYALPNYRQADYFNQDKLARHSLANLLLPTFPGGKDCLDDVMRGCIANTYVAINCGRPVLFLERELGLVLLGGKLPADLETQDIHPPWPGFRIMLPRGLLTIPIAGEACSLMFLDFGFLKGGEEWNLPPIISAELDLLSHRFYGPAAGKLYLSRLSFTYPKDAISINGIIHADRKDTPTAYGLTKPWPKGPLSQLSEFKLSLNTGWPTDESDKNILFRMENLALNLLMLLSSVPIEYQPEAVERREKTEGKRLIPALLRPRWVGDCLLRARAAGHVRGELPAKVNGRHVSFHYRRAHWTKQPHGPKHSLRKLIWLLPMRVGQEKTTA